MQSMRSLVQVLCFFTVVFARAGEFLNLSFEEANVGRLELVSNYGTPVYIGKADSFLNGWRVQYNGVFQSEIFFSETIGGDGLTLLNNPPRIQESYGTYSLGVWGFKTPLTGEAMPLSVSVLQLGRIPANVVGLQYFSYPAAVSFFANGTELAIQNQVADLSQFSGKDVVLEIRFAPGYAGRFDIFGFTTVPEPSEIAMLGLGLGVIGWQAWKRQRAHLPSLQNGGGRGSTHAPSTSADPV
jgi:hypothetical protein